MIARHRGATRLTLGSLCLGWLPLVATIVPLLSLQQLTKKADIILQARIVRSWTAWDSEHEFIWTHYELAATDFLKGQGKPKIIVSEPGGTVDGRSMDIQGTPRFHPGEELILFLYRTPIGYLRTVGYGQGRYSIAGGRVKIDLSGIELARSPNLTSGTALESLDGLSVAEFKRRVRTLITQQKSEEAR